MKWTPIASPNQVTIVKNRLEQIAKVLIEKEIENFPVLGGDGGIPLFLAYYYDYCKSPKVLSALEKKLQALSKFASRKYLSIYSGITGYGWLLQQLNFLNLIDRSSLLSDDLNDLLMNWMLKEIDEGRYDFLNSSMGVVMYLQNFNKKQFLQVLKEFIHKLRNYGISENNTVIKWETIIVEHKNKKGIDFGLSHGMASIVAILSTLYKNKMLFKKDEKLLKKAVNYLLTNRNSENNMSSFSDFSLDETNSRLAWCYGDLGIGYSLYKAGQTLNDNELMKEALHILLKTTLRKDAIHEYVFDAGLYYGSSGIMQIYNRLFQITGNVKFKEIAQYWLNDMFSKSVHENNNTGYKFCLVNSRTWIDDYSIMNGLSGLGLALLAAISHDEPFWDQCLLLS